MVQSNINNEVWVFAQQQDGQLADVTLELVGKARELADRLGVSVAAVLAGHQVGELTTSLIHQGADRVVVIDHPRLQTYTTAPYAHAVAEAARLGKPQVMLFGATVIGRDLAPRVASTLMCGLTADCTSLEIGDYTDKAAGKDYKDLLYQIRPAFGGNIIATIVNAENWPQCATVREGVMPMQEPDTSRKGTVETLEVAFDGVDDAVRVIQRVTAEKRVNLKGSPVVVAGGAGVGSPEGFALLKELAHVVGGELGASRAAVDYGYIDHDHQVGQTGVTVRPKLYIACGISGQVQHRAGMAESSKIVAINTDPQAPIFNIAHYRIVGDLHKVIPMMIEAYKKKQ